jgi:large subunit ribosomal protein L30
MRFIEIEQTGSPIRRHHSQKATLIGLGLNRIGRVAWVPDTLASRGMVAKVRHLVRINHDPATPKPPKVVPVYDENADAALLRALAFDPSKIVPESYGAAARKNGKTPDFKLVRDGVLQGYCEMKSPRDDFIFEFPEDGAPAIRKDVPFYRKLASHVRRAARQFDAVNPERKLPNILAFVCHSPDIERRDLIATIAGLPNPRGRPVFMLPRKMQQDVLDAARRIDLFLWIDAKKRTVQRLSPNGAAHQAAALLFALPGELQSADTH